MYKNLLLGCIAGVVLLSSCGKDDDDNNNGVAPQAVIIDEDITSARTLSKINAAGQTDYIVTEEIDILADVTIEPGVIIVFWEGTDFWVRNQGSLNAVGTDNEMIVFKGDQNTAGYWGGLFFNTDDVNNILSHVTIQNAGAGDHTIPVQKGAVIVYDNARLKMQHSEIEKSGGYGLYLDGVNVKLDEFSYNIIEGSLDAPVMALVPIFKFLDGTTTYTGNTKNYIDVNSASGIRNVQGSNVWKKLDVPYRLPSHRIDIQGNVEVQPGAEFIGQPNGGVRVVSGGSFKAIGTATDSISFRGEQQSSGYWPGFQFVSNSTLNDFSYVTISDGGGANDFNIPARKANLEVYNGATFKITNSTVKNSDGAGIYVVSGGNLTHSGNAYSGNSDGNVVHQ